jgi:ADP-heptose:LPS heptosyltransferase
MGDVAMVVPVLRKVLFDNPDTEITLLTNASFTGLFHGIDRLQVTAVDTKREYKGFTGLIKLFREVSKVGPFDKLLDLHDVLRSRILGLLFRLIGTGTVRIDKGRQEKRSLLHSKKLRPLQHSTERYADVFKKAGLRYSERPFSFPSIPSAGMSSTASPLIYSHAGPFIGFAPFARHQTKSMPMALCGELLNRLSNLSYRVFLFGGPENKSHFSEWEKKYPEVVSTVSLSLSDQIALITKMNAMISMDSANMHLAAIQGIPVLSIWGATDPCFGFSGLGTDPDTWIMTKKSLPCRPCSVFGNRPCINKNSPYECLTSIEPEDIITRLQQLIETDHGRG